MKMMIPSFLILFILSGCISSHTKRYYQIHFPENINLDFKKNDKVLLIELVDVEEIYNDYRLVYRTSPYQLNYYSYEFWIKRPGKLIRDSIHSFLSKNEIFKLVIQEFTEGKPDLLMKSRINAIEEYDIGQVWYARLAMELRIVDFKSGTTIISHHFDRRKRLSGKKVIMMPVEISKILAEEMISFIKKFSEIFN